MSIEFSQWPEQSHIILSPGELPGARKIVQYMSELCNDVSHSEPSNERKPRHNCHRCWLALRQFLLLNSIDQDKIEQREERRKQTIERAKAKHRGWGNS